jgi:hypothetical protein
MIALLSRPEQAPALPLSPASTPVQPRRRFNSRASRTAIATAASRPQGSRRAAALARRGAGLLSPVVAILAQLVLVPSQLVASRPHLSEQRLQAIDLLPAAARSTGSSSFRRPCHALQTVPHPASDPLCPVPRDVAGAVPGVRPRKRSAGSIVRPPSGSRKACRL